MRVLLLKNLTAQLDKYKIAFESKRFEPFFIPLITHTHVPEELLRMLGNNAYLENLQDIIITSQRTVECLSESVLPQLTPSLREILLSKNVYAVGPATEDFLLRIGFKNVKGGEDAGTGSVLADLIIDDLSNEDKSGKEHNELLLLVGEIRRDIIPLKLRSNGLEVREIVTYKTEELQDNLTRFKSAMVPGSWVVLFSPQGTKEILDYLKKNPESGVRIASIGPTTEKFLNDNGIQPQVVSAKPDADHLLDAINSYNSIND